MSGPQRFRKKPVVIEAMCWDGTAEGAYPIISWILAHDGLVTFRCSNSGECHGEGSLHDIAITTLEGTMTASSGDWIIRGIRGEFYPCKPGIFLDTYERIVS